MLSMCGLSVRNLSGLYERLPTVHFPQSHHCNTIHTCCSTLENFTSNPPDAALWVGYRTGVEQQVGLSSVRARRTTVTFIEPTRRCALGGLPSPMSVPLSHHNIPDDFAMFLQRKPVSHAGDVVLDHQLWRLAVAAPAILVF